MIKPYSISFWLDTRRKLQNGKHPVRLRVFTNAPRVQKLYPTDFEFTEADFSHIWGTLRPRGLHKELRKHMQAVLSHAEDTADNITPFSLTQFEKLLFRKSSESDNIFWHYEHIIRELRGNNQLGTASNYDLSLKSIRQFCTHKKGNAPNALLFSEVNVNWLNQYERFMTENRGCSLTTVSIYIRTLRTIFNKAIKDNEIDKSLYPFGSDAYQPPAVKRVKKALNMEQLKQLFTAKTDTVEQQRAKDFWYFSYTCNGMNIKDIALLKYENFDGETLTFLRAKTMKTNKANLREVVVYLTDYAKSIIQQYGNPNTHPKQYIFPILNETDSETAKRAKIQNFTRFINQNLKKLCVAHGITTDISTYWARHSFATNAIRQGASMEFVGEALSHSNTKTTMGYFAGFEDHSKKEMMEALMRF